MTSSHHPKKSAQPDAPRHVPLAVECCSLRVDIETKSLEAGSDRVLRGLTIPFRFMHSKAYSSLSEDRFGSSTPLKSRKTGGRVEKARKY